MAWGLEECVQRGDHFAICGRGRLDPGRRGANALIISGPAEQSALVHVSLRRSSPAAPGEDGEGDYEVDEKEKKMVGILESGVEKVEETLGIDNLYDPVKHAPGLAPEQRDQGQGAVQEGQGLRRGRRRGPDRGRVHRPHAARPALQRGHAPGHRGQGRRADPEREPDSRDDHAAELLPALREAGRDDRHGHDRGERVRPDLQAWRGADPDQQADDPARCGRCGLPDGAGQVRGRRRRHRRAAHPGPAGPGRDDQRGEVGDPVPDAQAPRRAARGAERQVPRA